MAGEPYHGPDGMYEFSRIVLENALTTARQAATKRNIHHGDTETRRKPKSKSQQSKSNLNTKDTERLRRTAEPKIPSKNSSRHGTNLIVSNTKDATGAVTQRNPA